METEYSKHLIYGNYRSMPGQDFPMDCETLAALQNNIQKLAVIASVAGCDRLVLTGCEVQGNVRSGGYVFVRGADNPDTGEILYHHQQPTSDYCRIAETHEHVNANTIEYRDAYTQRHLASGEGVGAMLWSSFKTLGEMSLSALLSAIRKEATDREAAVQRVKDDTSVKFVRGMILMWSGYIREIPDGWALCDGKDGRPDLRGRFIVGAGSDTTNDGVYKTKTTGNDNPRKTVQITLRAEDLPAHRHMYIGDSNAPGNDLTRLENVDGRSASGSGAGAKILTDSFIYDASGISAIRQSSSTITSTAIDVRPPYYALAYIMKL